MIWNDPFAWLVAGVLVLIAAKWLLMSVCDVRDRWGHRRTFSWNLPDVVADADQAEDDESDVLDTIHCRIDDVGERIDRLESRIDTIDDRLSEGRGMFESLEAQIVKLRHEIVAVEKVRVNTLVEVGKRFERLEDSVAEHGRSAAEFRLRTGRLETRSDDVGERIDRLEAADRQATSAIASLRTSCRSLDRSLTSTENDVEDLRRRVEALEGQCQPLADGLSEEEA